MSNWLKFNNQPIPLSVLYSTYIKKKSCFNLQVAASQLQPISAARIDRMDHDNTYTTDDKATKEQGKQLPTPLKLELDAALGVSFVLLSSENFI